MMQSVIDEPTLEPEVIHCIDGGDSLGYYLKGHVDAREFFDACVYWGHDPADAGIDFVRHLWWRNVPINDGSGDMRFMESGKGRRGSYAVTTLDVAGARRRRVAERVVVENGERLAAHAATDCCTDDAPCWWVTNLRSNTAMWRRHIDDPMTVMGEPDGPPSAPTDTGVQNGE